MFLSNIPFAHGRSGIVLSKSTVHDFVVTHNGTASRWDPLIHAECCGDFMLAKALMENGNVLGDMRPSISG